jgi:hypothetical protein
MSPKRRRSSRRPPRRRSSSGYTPRHRVRGGLVQWLRWLQSWPTSVFSRIPKWWKWAAAIVGAVATAIGALSGILSLLPQLSISAQAPVVASEALSSPFVITNVGLLPVRDVTSACVLNHVLGLLRIRGANTDSEVLDTPSVVEGIISMRRTLPDIGTLARNESATVPCNANPGFDGPQFPIHAVWEAEIIVAVLYRPPLLPDWPIFQRATTAGFRLLRQRDQSFRWLPIPVPLRRNYFVWPIDPGFDTSVAERFPDLFTDTVQ